jgi:hypothetical protein
VPDNHVADGFDASAQNAYLFVEVVVGRQDALCRFGFELTPAFQQQGAVHFDGFINLAVRHRLPLGGWGHGLGHGVISLAKSGLGCKELLYIYYHFLYTLSILSE